MRASHPTTDAVDLYLGELLEEAVEARAHQEIRDAFRQRAEAGSGSVVVEELEAGGGGGAIRVAGAVGRAAEDDNRIKRGPVASGRSAVAAVPELGGFPRAGGHVGPVATEGVRGAVGGDSAAAAGLVGRGETGRRYFHLLEEPAVAVGTDDGVLRPHPDETATPVAPVRGRRRHGRRHQTEEEEQQRSELSLKNKRT